MTEAQTEAVAWADAHTSNTGLPTYTELVEALRRLSETYDRYSATGRRHQPAAVQATAILNRIPA